MACDYQRALGLVQQPCCIMQAVARFLFQFRHPGRRKFREHGVGQFKLHVAGNINQHRTGPPLLRDYESLVDGLGQVFGRHHHDALLGAGIGDGADVAFLERLGTQGRARHLSGYGNQRHRIRLGPHDPGDQVGRAGAGRGDTHADLAADPRVGIGGMGRGLLVAHQDVPKLRIGP